MKIFLPLFILFLGLPSTIAAKGPEIHVNKKKLLYAVEKKENPHKNPNLVGDKTFRHKAVGYLQIRLPYLTDVNKIIGTKEIRKKWRKNKLTLADMKNQTKAEWVFLWYLSHYGKMYTKETGKVPTLEVYARIHNGGPEGWKKWTTRKYGKDVVAYAEAYQHNKKT